MHFVIRDASRCNCLYINIQLRNIETVKPICISNNDLYHLQPANLTHLNAKILMSVETKHYSSVNLTLAVRHVLKTERRSRNLVAFDNQPTWENLLSRNLMLIKPQFTR